MRRGRMCRGDYFGPREFRETTARHQRWDGSATIEGGSAKSVIPSTVKLSALGLISLQADLRPQLLPLSQGLFNPCTRGVTVYMALL